MSLNTFEEVRSERNQKISEFTENNLLLNQFHDQLMLAVIKIAINKTEKEIGSVPSPFSFFVMGSAGRYEQGFWSDQDHGIIYEETNDQVKQYFLELGKTITYGLDQVGYQYCHGEVMASNPSWCKSVNEWQQQLHQFINERNWESIRSLLIFMDGRTLYGEDNYLNELKGIALKSIHNEQLLRHIYNNTLYYKKGMSVLGQLLPETHGSFSGQLNLKETVLLPFVNAIRFLAIKENVTETSTLARIDQLSEQFFSREEKQKYQQHFTSLLKYRLNYGNQTSYEASHFLKISNLTKEQKNETKEIMKAIKSLYSKLGRIIEKEGFYGDA